MNNVIELEELSHGYGSHAVLRGLNLSVPAGSIYGFLGRNGAGKSTCIRILSGLLGRQSGAVRVLGNDPATWGRAALERFGYVGESAFLPGQARVGRPHRGDQGGPAGEQFVKVSFPDGVVVGLGDGHGVLPLVSSAGLR